MAQLKYDAIICDSDLDARMRLKQVTTSVINFGKTFQYQSLRESLTKLNGAERVDVVFVSHRFTREEIGEFVGQAKQTAQGQDSAYILVMKASQQDSGSVAQNVMLGVDGFLFEPYSVDQLVEITELSARVRKERSLARETAAFKFLLNDIVNSLDLIAFMKASGMEVGRQVRKLKELSTLFTTLSPESTEIYYGVMIDVFEAAPLPRKVPQKRQYSGASSRVRKKAEEKMVEDLEREFLGGDK